jgi:hypothetical protein
VRTDAPGPSGFHASRHPDDLLALTAASRLSSQSLGEEFVVSGVITGRQVDPAGHLTLTIDASRGPADQDGAMTRLLALAIALGLLAWQGGELFALRWRPRPSP